jgi:enamine deaminase RidA (YjgF/YER057c/UK114 family)
VRVTGIGMAAAVLFSLGASYPAGAETHGAPSKTVVIPAGAEHAYDDYHYAPAVRVGDMVIVSGVPAYGADTYAGKIRNMFERVKRTLSAAGADMADVVEITTFHAQATNTEVFQREFDEFLKVHAEFFPSGYPAWTAVGTTALLAKDSPVEMRVVAVIGAGTKVAVERAPKP